MLNFVWTLFFFSINASANTPNEGRDGIKWGALPIANYSSDQGYTLGALAQRFDYGASKALPFENLSTLQASFASRGPKIVWLSYERAHIGPDHLRFRADLSINDNLYQKYYGLGNRSTRSDVAESRGDYRYHHRQIGIEISARRHFNILPNLDFQLGVSGHKNDSESVAPTTTFERDYSNGIHAYYSSIVLRLIAEQRDSEFIPSRGYLMAASVRHSPGFLGQIESWSRLDVDYRRYDSILDNRWLWLATQFRYTATSTATPLSEKARLGSLGTVRGLPLNRYIDSQSWSARTELRSMNLRTSVFDLPLKIGQGIFVDFGRVGQSPAELISNGPTHLTYGFTLFGSYFTDDFLGSADFGFSQDGLNFYLNLGHAF